MIKFAPFPNEFIIAHLSRLAAVNTVTSTQSLLQRQGLTLQYHHRILADICGTTADVYLYEHTLGPMMSLRATSARPVGMTNLGMENPQSRGVCIATRLLCKFCLLSRDDDIERFGSSYRHREHQVARVYLCPHYDSPLRLCGPALWTPIQFPTTWEALMYQSFCSTPACLRSSSDT